MFRKHGCRYMWGHIQFYGRGGFLLINFILLRFFACRFQNMFPKYVSKKNYLSILNIDKFVSKMFQKNIYFSKIVSFFFFFFFNRVKIVELIVYEIN